MDAKYIDSVGPITYKVETPSQEASTITGGGDGSFCELASIEWHAFGSSKSRYQGKELRMKEFMPHKKSFNRGLASKVLLSPE